jgi:hypothetical protein
VSVDLCPDGAEDDGARRSAAAVLSRRRSPSRANVSNMITRNLNMSAGSETE